MLCCHFCIAMPEQTISLLLSFTCAQVALASEERTAQSQDHHWLHFAVIANNAMKVGMDDQALRCRSHDGKHMKHGQVEEGALGTACL